jgi:hypothetical protein
VTRTPVHDLDPVAKPAMSGRALARDMRDAPPGARATAVLPLCNGTALAGLTRAQAAAVGRVSVHSIATAASASPDERDLLLRGVITLRDVRRVHARSHALSGEDVEAFIARVGIDVVMNALDRLTAPKTSVSIAE